MESNQHIDKIDDYLAGRLGPTEQAALEKEITADPVLAEQVNFQKQVVEGIKGYRKAQLIARLDAIDVSVVGSPSVWQSIPAKVGYGIATASLILAGAFYALDDTQTLAEVQPEQVVDQPVTESQVVAIDDEIPAEEAEVIEEKTTAKPNNTAKKAPKKIAVPTPNISMPDESEGTSAQVDGNEGVISDETSVSKGEPVLNASVIFDEGRFSYTYIDGKLSLIGNFSDEMYEILEINTTNGKDLYLKYQDKYYGLSVTAEPLELVELTEQSLIDQLSEISEN